MELLALKIEEFVIFDLLFVLFIELLQVHVHSFDCFKTFFDLLDLNVLTLALLLMLPFLRIVSLLEHP